MLTATYRLSVERIGSLAQIAPAGRSTSRIHFLNAVGTILADAFIQTLANRTAAAVPNALKTAQNTETVGITRSNSSGSSV